MIKKRLHWLIKTNYFEGLRVWSEERQMFMGPNGERGKPLRLRQPTREWQSLNYIKSANGRSRCKSRPTPFGQAPKTNRFAFAGCANWQVPRKPIPRPPPWPSVGVKLEIDDRQWSENHTGEHIEINSAYISKSVKAEVKKYQNIRELCWQ